MSIYLMSEFSPLTLWMTDSASSLNEPVWPVPTLYSPEILLFFKKNITKLTASFT